jgi:hypothetical protein
MISISAFLPALAVAVLFGPSQHGAERQQPAPFVACLPGAIRVGSETIRCPNPLAEALRRAGPGTIVDVAPGEYPAFGIGLGRNDAWNANTPGGNRGAPVVVRGRGARIVPGSSGDTITISQGAPCAWIRFEGLTIVAGNRAAVMFYKCGPGQKHEGFQFVDCTIDGGFDHASGRGSNSKWGVWAHGLAGFEYRGGSIFNLRNEHAFYLQNAQGDITIENVRASRLGRTFLQVTARPGEGPPGVGTVTVRNCIVEDACIAIGDDYKGGYAFTIAGRHTGVIQLENNRYRAGFVPEIAKLTRPGVRYGTGALVAWDGFGQPNGRLVLRNNDFEMAPGCGDRPLVAIGGCTEVDIAGTNRFVSSYEIALELDPPREAGFESNPNGRVRVDSRTTIQGGAIRRAGKPITLSDLTLPPLAPDRKPPPSSGGR